MKTYNCLTQEDKDKLCFYHWEEGTLWEDEYYHELFDKYEWLENVYNECVNETIKTLGYGGTCYEFECEEYDEWLLFLMQELDERLEVGLYEGR